MIKIINSNPYVEQPVPFEGETYHYYDDGKIKPSCHSTVKILKTIKFENAERAIREVYFRLKEEFYWILAKTTDYIVIGYNEKDCPGFTMLFARSQDGGWYGFETSGDDYWTGKLITDPDFEHNY